MKKTFSAYVRLSQTRTGETMQTAFHGSRAGRSGPCPARGLEGHRGALARTVGRGGGVGAIIGARPPANAKCAARTHRLPERGAERSGRARRAALVTGPAM
ncbi:hypothetical protein GCM10010385_40310 [Streptomyces geysiriensis]|nr:hypothetical protein GCM10010385_40310 [Streptomyces geysiriensis]